VAVQYSPDQIEQVDYPGHIPYGRLVEVLATGAIGRVLTTTRKGMVQVQLPGGNAVMRRDDVRIADKNAELWAETAMGSVPDNPSSMAGTGAKSTGAVPAPTYFTRLAAARLQKYILGIMSLAHYLGEPDLKRRVQAMIDLRPGAMDAEGVEALLISVDDDTRRLLETMTGELTTWAEEVIAEVRDAE